MLKVKATMREEHIGSGNQNEPRSCPLALLIMEATGFQHVEVQPGTTLIWNDGAVAYEVATPWYMERFMEEFDAGREVQPIEIDLEFQEVKYGEDSDDS